MFGKVDSWIVVELNDRSIHTTADVIEQEIVEQRLLHSLGKSKVFSFTSQHSNRFLILGTRSYRLDIEGKDVAKNLLSITNITS